MENSKDHKAAAEPPLDCRVGHWIETKDRLPKHCEWVLAAYLGVYQPRYVKFWRDGGNNPHFGGQNADNDGKGSQPATHWMRIAEVPNEPAKGRASARSLLTAVLGHGATRRERWISTKRCLRRR